MSIHRGDVVTAGLDPAAAAWQGKVRPVVILSNDGANRQAAADGYGVVTVASLTTSTAEVRPYQVLIPAAESPLPRDSKVQVEQLRSIDVSRIVRPIGRLRDEHMAAIDQALAIHLSLEVL